MATLKIPAVVSALALFGLAFPQLAPAADAATVVISGFAFAPASLTVTAGTTVVWTNKDDEVHSVAGEHGLFRSGALDTGERFSFRFDKPGTYQYACTLHSRMTGTIIVQ
jgi:plastocyanin